MQASRHFFALLGILAGWLLARPAEAVVLLEGETDPASFERAWVAVAVAPGQTTTWIAVGTRSAGRFGVAIPLRDGQKLDFASRAWLDALELATAPRVLPPEQPPLPACAPDDPAIDVATDPLPEATLDPSALATVAEIAELPAVAAAHGLIASDAAVRALRAASAERGALLLVYDAQRDASVTEPIRVVTLAPEPSVPFGSLRVGVGHDFGVTYFTLGEARWVPGELESVDAEELPVRWHAASGESDYAVARETRLREDLGLASIVEPTAAQILYDWETLPGETGVVRSVARNYLEAAVDPDQVDVCLSQLIAVRQAGLTVARACVPGALAATPEADGSPCGETSESEPVDPSVLRCGGADELAVAHAGLTPDVIITRLVTRPTGAVPGAVSLIAAATDSEPAVVHADTIDAGECEPTVIAGSSGGSGGGSSWIPPDAVIVSGTTPMDGAPSTYGDEGDYDDEYWYWDTTVVVEADDSSCSGSTEPDDDYSGETCSSDSSGSSDGCSSDTDDGYDGETCGGDGSGEGCSGESSDSGYSGETCGGGSSDSGYSGETCSADCSVSRRRRPRLSTLVFTLCAGLILLRRASRPRAASPPPNAGRGWGTAANRPHQEIEARRPLRSIPLNRA